MNAFADGPAGDYDDELPPEERDKGGYEVGFPEEMQVKRKVKTKNDRKADCSSKSGPTQ